MADLFTVEGQDEAGVVPSGAFDSGALSSEDGRYRYKLWRRWGLGGSVCFIGLNPSTADASADDATTRRLRAFATAWGYSAYTLVNLFAYRATEPSDMKRAPDPIGPENDQALADVATGVQFTGGPVVACWGAHGGFMGRSGYVRSMLEAEACQLQVLKLCKGGEPGHPLYLPGNLFPIPWR